MSNTCALPRLAVFGAGGLGIEMLSLLSQRKVANLVAILDKTGYAYDSNGYVTDVLAKQVSANKGIREAAGFVESAQSIRDFMKSHATDIDAIFFALPNLPNTFIPEIASFIAQETDFSGVIVDALKRTSAVSHLSGLDSLFRENDILYLAGCGATPGILTTAASLAAQSFVEVQSVKITFGVGIANWQAYRATIREDIAHMPGFDVESAAALSEGEVDSLLDKTNGLIELVDMEHADDIMLEMAGICPASKVSVGGVVDTRNPEKPLSTNVQLTGVTYQGKVSTHTFTLGDETTMAANVNGSVLGFMSAGVEMYHHYDVSGFKTAAQLLPKFAPTYLPVREGSVTRVDQPEFVAQ